MSTPLATPSELGVYLGQTIDPGDPRGLLVLQLAHDLCETIVSPVPVLGKGVELETAARLYTNATSAHQMSLGSASVSFGAQGSSTGIGGLYLSQSQITTLRRLAGRSGAYSISMVPDPTPPLVVPSILSITPEVATTGIHVIVTGSGFDGLLTLTFGGITADTIVALTDEILDVVMPAGTAGDVAVVATNAIGASNPYTFTRG